jgi:TetR/AcrR family transcriptional repressor of multidrug resistance operon
MTGPTNATPRRRDGEATRQRLLRAALDLFTTVGFRGTTTPAIASRASVAEGTIYRHFNSKEHLLNEVYRESQRWALGVVREVEDADRSARAQDRLVRLARRFFESADRDPAALRMVLFNSEESSLDERSREQANEFRKALQQVLAAGKSDGLIRPGPAELWSAVWLALIGFAAEKVASRQWPVDHPHLGMVIDAAWDAVSERQK